IDLGDRVVVISGGGRGIGRTLVERFAAERCRVAALDLDFPDALPEGTLALTGDVSDTDSVRSMIDAVVDRFGTIDVLVNNAGINVVGTIEELTLEQWRRCFDVNVAGVFLLSQAVIPTMKRMHRGR